MTIASRALRKRWMRDACQVGTQSVSTPTGPSGGTVTYTYGSEFPCSVLPGDPEQAMVDTEVTITDVKIKLPLTATVTSRSRIKVTKKRVGRFLSTLAAPEIYAVKGDPNRLSDCFEAKCQRITEASVK